MVSHIGIFFIWPICGKSEELGLSLGKLSVYLRISSVAAFHFSDFSLNFAASYTGQ